MPDRAAKVLGWRPSYTLEQGLAGNLALFSNPAACRAKIIRPTMKAILLIGGLGTLAAAFNTDHPETAASRSRSARSSPTRSNFSNNTAFGTSFSARPTDPEVFHEKLGDGSTLSVSGCSTCMSSNPWAPAGRSKTRSVTSMAPTVICNGDILMDLDLNDLLQFHRDRKALVSIALTRVQDPNCLWFNRNGTGWAHPTLCGKAFAQRSHGRHDQCRRLYF